MQGLAVSSEFVFACLFICRLSFGAGCKPLHDRIPDAVGLGAERSSSSPASQTIGASQTLLLSVSVCDY